MKARAYKRRKTSVSRAVIKQVQRLDGGVRPPDVSEIGAKLQSLGYERYADYLLSVHWVEMRRRMLAGRRCGCGARATQLHHLTYERLGDELPTDLEPLCERCHRGRHSLRPRRRRRRKDGPTRGPETIPAETGFEASMRRIERL